MQARNLRYLELGDTPYGEDQEFEDDDNQGPVDSGTDPALAQLPAVPYMDSSSPPLPMDDGSGIGNVPPLFDTSGPPVTPSPQDNSNPFISDAQAKLLQRTGAIEAQLDPQSPTNPNGYPVRPQPTWWERLAAGAVGGAAGYSNAARRAAPIDIQKVTEPLLYPGYEGKLAAWQSRVIPLEKSAEIASQQLSAGYAAQKAQSEANLRKAQAFMNIKRGGYYEGLGAKGTEIVTPEMEQASMGIFHRGTVIPAGTGTRIMEIAAGRYEKPEETVKVTDPDFAKRLGKPVNTSVPKSIYQAAVTAGGRNKPAPTTAELGLIANGWKHPDYPEITPDMAKKAINDAKDRAPRDPLIDWMRQQQLSAAQQKDLEAVGNKKNTDWNSVMAQRDAELQHALPGRTEQDIWSGNDDTERATLQGINRRFAPQLQSVQDNFVSAARAHNLQPPEFAVDPNTLQSKPRTVQVPVSQGAPSPGTPGRGVVPPPAARPAPTPAVRPVPTTAVNPGTAPVRKYNAAGDAVEWNGKTWLPVPRQ